MLYLEDYIELIEQLPQDLRDRFTEMRELDLKVQNSIDTLDGRVRRFFTDARKNKTDGLSEEYKNIHKGYEQALDDADEKVLMANQIYDLVDRHLRKLDQELTSFKMELEADCSGITEMLERRSTVYNEDTSLDMLYNATYNAHSGEIAQKRKFGDIERLSTAVLTNGETDKTLNNVYSPLGATYPLSKPSSSSSSYNSKSIALNQKSSSLLSQKPALADSLKETGRGAQASLKAMTAAQKKAEQLGNSLSMSGLLAAPSSKSSNSSSSYVDVTGNSYLQSSSSSLKQNAMQNRAQKGAAGRRGQKGLTAPTHGASSKNMAPETPIDWVPDPNEPTYCLCNQVSYGEMVGCDNPSCSIEWFHYGCVGLTDAPKGKWYCPDCQTQIKKRRIR